MNEARVDENMSPEMENFADEGEAQQAFLKAEAEGKAEGVTLMIIWTDNDGDEKTEEENFPSETQALNYWEMIEGEFDETGIWYATDYEIL